MNLRELARRDGALILGGSGGTPFTLRSPLGAEYEAAGIIDDVGLSVDAGGVQVAGRTASASYPSEQVSDGGLVVVPREGWTLSFTDLHGRERRYAVTYAAPDAMLGITRLFLAADLSGGGGDAEEDE